MRALCGLAALALFGIAGPAAATDWYLAGETADGSAVSFVDKDSVRPAGEALMGARVYVVMAQAVDRAVAMDATVEFDCASSRRRLLRLIAFDEESRRIAEGAASGNWRAVTPGSQDDAVRTFVCSGSRSAPASLSHGSAYPFAAGRARLARNRANDAQGRPPG